MPRSLSRREVVRAGLALTTASILSMTMRPLPAAAQGISSLPDWTRLKTIPADRIIENGMLGTIVKMITTSQRQDAWADVAAMPHDRQTLFWLAWLLYGWGPKKSGREGLHTYFFLDNETTATPVLAALRDAEMTRQADAFAKIMDLFGTPFPADSKQREAHFAWSTPGREIAPYTTVPNELNAFDHQVMDLGAAFGSKAEFRRAITTYADRVPALREWVDQHRANMSDEDRVAWLTDQLAVDDPEVMVEAIKAWRRPYAILYLVSQFDNEMMNGSVEQFFFNSTGALAPDVVVAFREIGLNKHADAVQRGIAMFTPPYPVNTELRRKIYWSREGGPSFDKDLEALTGDVDDGAITPALIALAKRNDILPH